MGKTNAQRCKEYRERQRVKLNKPKKDKPKTNSQRMREYRLRKQTERTINDIANNQLPSSGPENVDHQDDPLTPYFQSKGKSLTIMQVIQDHQICVNRFLIRVHHTLLIPPIRLLIRNSLKNL